MTIYFNDTDNTTLEITPTDSSYRYREIMGENNLTIYFSLTEFVEIPINATCEFQGETYTLLRSEDFKKNGTRNFEYTIVMYSDVERFKRYKLRNTIDGRIKFSYVATPKEFIQLVVDNLNMRESGWSVGECIEATEQSISFSHNNCAEVLTTIADTFETEYEVVGKVIHLHKVEYNKDNPLPLSYGKGNGFKPGTGRSNYDDSFPVEILYVEGGSDNIDASTYGSSELLLPISQTYEYEGRTYVTDELGLSIRRADKDIVYNNEDSLDCTHIYPSRTGEVTGVVVVDEDENWYDIIDSTIPDALDFSQQLIAGETPTIIFQTGMLATREFGIETNDDGDLTGYDPDTKKFQIVPEEYSGIMMPSETYKPAIGDTYVVFGVSLPDAYICDNDTQTGASWDMFKEAVAYMYEHEDPCFTFTGDLDGIYAKANWLEIGGRIVLGGYVDFSDTQFEGAEVRIMNIKEYINKPYSPTLDLSNTTVGSLVGSELKKIEANEVVVEDNYKSSIQYTKRTYRQAKEAQEMIEAAVGVLDTMFTESISPATITTMGMLVGEESLEFHFIKAIPTSDTDTSEEIILLRNYDAETKVFTLTNPYSDEETIILQHLTLGIEDITYARSELDYKCWTLGDYTSPYLGDDSSATYYVYAKCRVNNEEETNDDETAIILSTSPIGMTDDADYYHFWIGILGAEYDGDRAYTEVYGYTEVLPGQITTKIIRSTDGTTYFNLAEGEIGGRIVFVDTDGNTTTIGDGIDASKTAIAQQLGYDSYDAMVAAAAAGNTVIAGGYINTSLVEVDHLKTKGEEGQIVIDSDQIQVYDYDGDRKLIIDGGVYSSHDSVMNESSTPTVSAITSLPVNYSSTVQQSSPTLTYSRSLTIGSFTIPADGFHQVRVPSLYFRFKSHEYSNYSSSSPSGYTGYISAMVMVGSQYQSVGFGIPATAGGLIATPNTDLEFDQTSDSFLITTTEGGEYTVTIDVSLTIKSNWLAPTGNLDVEIEIKVADGENGDNLTYESFYNYSRLYSNGFLLRASSQKYFSLLNATNESLIEARDGDSYLEMVEEYISEYSGYRKYSNGQLEVWGYVSSSSTTGSVTFPNSITFTNAYYNIQTTISGTNMTTFADIRPYSLTASGFSYRTLAVPTVTGSHSHSNSGTTGSAWTSGTSSTHTHTYGTTTGTNTASITATTSSGLPFYWIVKGRWK
ncbi:MAG: hypothetical protein SNH55_01785 [Rikenellaceae bacterium]